jgi:hypothetical protein
MYVWLKPHVEILETLSLYDYFFRHFKLVKEKSDTEFFISRLD